MLLGSVRHRLTRDDAQLVVQLLSHEEQKNRHEFERLLAERGLDALLDHPRLSRAILRHDQGACASQPLFFYSVVRRTLLDVNEPDRSVADFVAGILLHFGVQQRANRIREHDDVMYDSLVALAADAECSDPTRSFLVRAHLGHYALWIAGIFPDYVEERRHRRGGPDLEYFDEMGSRGYSMAAHHRLAHQHGLVGLFERMAEQFPRVRFALNRVSDQVFFAARSNPDKLLRQVRDESRWGLVS